MMEKWGTSGRNAMFMFWEDNKECDMCDKVGNCASISDVPGNVSVICDTCLDRMLKERLKEDVYKLAK